MQRPLHVSRRLFARLLVPVALMLGLVAIPAATSAQYYDVFSNAPFDQLTGLQFAGQRLYQGSNELNIYIDVAVFENAGRATIGLTTLNGYYLDAYAAAASAIPFEPVNPPIELPDALAFQGFLDIGNGPYADIALMHVQDGGILYTAFVSNYAYDSNPEEVALEVAGAMLDSILATPAVTATPAAVDPASAMARLPLETDAVPARYGMTYSEDTEWFVPSVAEPTIPDEGATDPGDLLYGDAEGLVTAVSREFAGSGDTVLEALIEIAEFDSEDHAAEGYTNGEAALAGLFEGPDVTFEDAEAGIDADMSQAWIGQRFDDGLPVAVLIAQSGNYVISVLVASDDADLVLDLAEDIAQATIDADTGDGDAQFDDSGTSTGGIWDKLPAAGHVVLQGMEPTYDETLYP